MKTITVLHGGKTTQCNLYSEEDDFSILEKFFNWRMQEQLASAGNLKRPALPVEFSVPFCCRMLGLAHNVKSAKSDPDCFEIATAGETTVATKVVKVKATITEDGFTDIKKDIDFDELCWLDCSDYRNLSFHIYQFKKEDLANFLSESKTARASATVHMEGSASELGIRPVFEGRVGISVEKIEWSRVDKDEEESVRKALDREGSLFASF